MKTIFVLLFATYALEAAASSGPFTDDYTRTHEEIVQVFDGFAATHPALVEKTHLITTPGGRDLSVYTFGNRSAPNRVLLLCNHHGDERWVAQLCLDFSRYLVFAYDQGDAEIRRILDTVGVDVLPVGNPDGFARGERYNQRGNDINRNFPYMWNHVEPGTSNARPGPYAASEAETQALMGYQKGFAGRWLVTLNYHLRYENSDGENFILLPWAYTRGRTLTVEELARYQPFFPSRDRAPTFTVDTVPNVFYPCPGTHTDWTWATLGSPALTMELGHGYRLPRRDIYVRQLLQEENLPVFLHFLSAAVDVVD